MKKLAFVGIGVPLVAFAIWAFIGMGGDDASLEYRYAPVEKKEIVRSISATGQLVPLTTVDVKSKAGGIVDEIAVEEGTVVKIGDLIARIDPRDTEAVYDQAEADVVSSRARVDQAQDQYELQKELADKAIEEAKRNVEIQKIRVERAKLNSDRQPVLSQANVDITKAAYESALSAQEKLLKVTIPQLRRDVQGNLAKTKADLESSEAQYKRQKELLEKGYVSQSDVDRAKASYEAAKSAYNTASQRAATLEQDIEATIKNEELGVQRTKASYEQAKANMSQSEVMKTNLAEAEKQLANAELAYHRAIDNKRNVEIRAKDVLTAKASVVRNQVSLDNAKVQLDSTTVLAPRDGVVTLKYIEEGTIIPPGTSIFSEGTSIVQISDVSKMFVECLVDEADIGQVKAGQQVRVVTEASPGETLDGIVRRVNPAALTEANVTTVKVRVEILPGSKQTLLPGMNATCEFITLLKKDVVVVPLQAVEEDGEKFYVRVKTDDPLKPETRVVQVGERGNDRWEIVSGLEPGEEIVIAELNLRELREIQRQMQEAQESGGLAGGNQRRRPRAIGGS